MSETPGQMFRTGTKSSAGVDVTEEGALSLSAVFAAVNLLSSVIGSLPLNCYRKRSGGGKDIATGHPAYYLLHTEFNSDMTAAVARRLLNFHRLLWGNSYAEVQWAGNGKPYALWPLEPWRVRSKRDDDSNLYYLVDGGRKVAAGDMLHNQLMSYDGVCGRSFVEFAVESLGLGLGAQEFSATFFGNGATHGGLIVNPGTPPEEQRIKIKQSWKEDHQGPQKANKVGVLWGGWQWQDAKGVDPDKAQLMEARRFAVEEVARWFNLPPHLLRDLSRSTNNNIEHQGIDFVTYTLMPILVDYEQEYDRKLLAPPDLFSKHNVAALLRGDNASRAEYYNKLFQIGVYSINDISELEDRNPVPGGDVRFVPLNMVPLEQAIKPKADLQEQPPQQEQGQEDEEEQEEAPDNMAARLALLTHTLTRLAKVEANELRRAAKSPDKLFAWMDEFYPKLEAMLAESLGPVLPFCGTLIQAGTLAKEWQVVSRSQILETSEAKPKNFPSAVEAMLQFWEGRPAKFAAELLGVKP